jgi:hypothetical protein
LKLGIMGPKGDIMKMKAIGAAIAFAAILGGSASAETNVEKYGLGTSQAAPEKSGKLTNEATIRVRLIKEKSGELANSIGKGEIIVVRAEVLGREAANGKLISLICSAKFIDAAGETSESSVDSKPCFEGQTDDYYVADEFLDLDMKLRFRGSPEDANGTYGVVVKVQDSISGKQVVLVPTYSWQGGSS